MKKILLVCFMLVIAFTMISCNNNQTKYKETSKYELEQYLAQKNQDNYSYEDWNIILSFVNNAKKDIDLILNETKQSIDNVKTIKKYNIDIKMPGEEQFTKGDGSLENPYIIDTTEKLIYFSNCINEGKNLTSSYELANDIDLKGIEWVSIGISENNKFKGHFNGNGYEISNYQISKRLIKNELNNLGLFGYNEGLIENVGIVNANIDINWKYEFGYNQSINVGSIVGVNSGTIINCYSFGNIDLDYSGTKSNTSPTNIYVGGIAGINNNIISDVYTLTNININYCDDNGKINAAGIAIGGIIENSLVIATKSIILSNYPNSSLELVNEYLFGGKTENNNYFYDQKNEIQINSCSISDLNSIEFYKEKLAWSNKWNLDKILFENGEFINTKYPKINAKIIS